MLNARSERNLKGVHPDLQKVMRRAAELHSPELTITEGLRTVERQRELVAKGASKTMNSRHLTGHAVDIAFIIDGVARWDWPLFAAAAKTIKKVAKEMKVPIVWGGDWVSFKDSPHFELDRKFYPAKKG